MRCRYRVLLAVWIGVRVACGAQSFDCEKATTAVEKAVCAGSALSLADDKLAAAYKQVMREVPEDVKMAVRADEASWLNSMGNSCATKPTFQENFAT